MSRAPLACVAIVMAAAALLEGQAPRGKQPASAAPLVARVLGARGSKGFRFRATLTRTNMQTKAQQVRQLIVTGRREASRSITMFRVAWPEAASRDAWVIEDSGDHLLRGFRYESGQYAPLTPQNRPDRFAGSDLTLEDLEFAFWFWPTHIATGAEAVGEYDCTIVESSPPAQAVTGYSLVKSWIAPALSVPLRIEQFGRDRRLVKRLGMYRVLKLGDRWLPTILTVEPADGRMRTAVEGVKYESGLELTDADFSRAAAQRPIAASERGQ